MKNKIFPLLFVSICLFLSWLIIAQENGVSRFDKSENYLANHFKTSSERWENRLGNIQATLDYMGVKPGMIVGDAGAGQGFSTYLLSSRVGADGKVYGVEIEQSLVNNLNSLFNNAGRDNVSIHLGEIADPVFPRNDLDFVLFLYAFHDFTDYQQWLENLKKYLKPGARVATIDFDPAKTGRSGHGLSGYSQRMVIDAFEKAGFKLEKENNSLKTLMFLVFSYQAQ